LPTLFRYWPERKSAIVVALNELVFSSGGIPMKKQLVFLLGSVAGLMTLSAVQAAPISPSPQPAAAQSYEELLKPVASATSALAADDLMQVKRPQHLLHRVQYHHHHHHHHHHRGPFVPGFGVFVGPPAYAYQDCYWTRGRPYWNGWRWVRPRMRVCD